ncbi:TPA: hypothetical protein MFN42_004105 [Klebsiella quasipneumoniae subsp. quasipneumoniae]|nr:hypothetical protein [Klebsiella quasipneumoniae subsp. quasipneumoniae]
MVLHALSRPVIPFADPSWRGLSLSMHLHENRPTKRAGEAGKALRTRYYSFVKTSSNFLFKSSNLSINLSIYSEFR